MTLALIQRIRVGHWSIRAVIIITHQIIPKRHQMPLTETATQGWVVIVHTGVNNGKLDALPRVPQSSELIHLGHDMRSPSGLGDVIIVSSAAHGV